MNRDAVVGDTPQVSQDERAVGERASEVIVSLRRELIATPALRWPSEHGVIAYRLGLAYSESPNGDPTINTRQALRCFYLAAQLLDSDQDPVLHARVLNGAGAAHKVLGERSEALKLFGQAAELLKKQGEYLELAAVLNNFGLVKTELGESDEALDYFNEAVGILDESPLSEPWAQAATFHNRGLARASRGTLEELNKSLTDYELAQRTLDPQASPYLYGLILHSQGVARTNLGILLGPSGETPLHDALEDYELALAVFLRSEFPFHHALTKHNIARALIELGGDENLRRAIVSLEDALVIFDPRLHREPWKQAYALLEEVEERLERSFPGASRSDHFAALVGGSSPVESEALLRERLTQLLELPTQAKGAALQSLSDSIVRLGPSLEQVILRAELQVLMELPSGALESVLRAQLESHDRLSSPAKQDADRALELSIGTALNTPQRVFVRDFLYSIGYERP